MAFIFPTIGRGRGEDSERRFLRAVRKRTKRTPKYLVRVLVGSVRFDLMGVDFRARIKKPGYRDLMSVPFQIKSSERGKAEYYEKHPDAKAAGVPVLVIRPEMTDEGIREMFYAELHKAYAYDRYHFQTYFEGLARRRLSRRGAALVQHIRDKRTGKI